MKSLRRSNQLKYGREEVNGTAELN